MPIKNDLKYRVRKPDESNKILIDIQALDPEPVASQSSIAIEEYERARNPKHGELAQLFVGIIGEYAFKQTLKTYKFKAVHYEIEREHWVEGKATTDFELIPSGVGLEICTTPPTRRYQYGIVKANKLCRDDWKYAVLMKLESLKYDCIVTLKGQRKWYNIDASRYYPYDNQMFREIERPSPPPSSSTELIGKAVICGYAPREEIEKGLENKDEESSEWRFSPAGGGLTPYYDGIVKKLDAIVESRNTGVKLMTVLKEINGE